MTIQEFKTSAIKKLKNVSPTPALDLNVMLEHLLGWDRTFLLAHSSEELSDENLNWMEKAVEKRLTGLPVAYITGIKNFYGLDFIVTPDVLIPKPDTEILVERALTLLDEFYKKNHFSSQINICDMCTGSGCIGISVLSFCHKQEEIAPAVTFADISSKALEVAKANNQKILFPYFQKNISFVETNLFENIPSDAKFDLILTNPPYIPAKMVDELLTDGRSEPRLALDGDISLDGNKSNTSDGLEIIRNLLKQAEQHLNPNGIILMETGEYNAEAAAQYAASLGFLSKFHKDLENQLRVVELKLS